MKADENTIAFHAKAWETGTGTVLTIPAYKIKECGIRAGDRFEVYIRRIDEG